MAKYTSSNADVTGNLNKIRYTSASQTKILAKYAEAFLLRKSNDNSFLNLCIKMEPRVDTQPPGLEADNGKSGLVEQCQG
jgi:hypothetical protein